MLSRKELGNLAEELAATYLISKGYEILARNYQKPWGEIDIIDRNNHDVVFVEVKANAKDFGEGFQPEVRVHPKKLATIQKTASLFLQYELKNLDLPWQIDIISIVFLPELAKAKVTHFKNVAEALW